MDRVQPDGKRPGEKADQWGIYVGLWAPTFMALGIAIKTGESNNDVKTGEGG